MPKSKRSLAKTKKASATEPPLTRMDLPTVSAGLFPTLLLQNQDVWCTFLTQYQDKLGMEGEKIGEMLGKRGEYVRNLGQKVNELGGWLEVTGKDAWNDIKLDEIRDFRTDYENYLFPILKFLEFQQKYPSPAPYSLSHLRPSALRPIKVFTPPTSGVLTQAFWDEVLAQDIAILRGFPTKVWRFDHSLFSFEYLKTHHGTVEIEVLRQDRDPDREIMKVHSGEKVKSTLFDYIQNQVMQGKYEEKIPFAVNVDIGSWSEQIDQFQAKFPEYLLFGSAFDCLNHLRLHINGMSLPQIYVKVAGSWTGAHQENLSFAAINLNHGPGECQWWGVCPTEVGKVREKVGEKLGFDIAKSETLWWPDENWLLSEGYGCYYGLQRPDDLIYVGPGTLHWVKTTSPTVNSSWNIGPKTLTQFQAAYSRNALNETAGVESLVQINTLAMDLVNTELPSLPIDLVKYLQERLKEQFDREKRLLEGTKLPTLGVFPGHQVRRCEGCKREILFAYAVATDAHCLQCAASLPAPVPNCHQMFTLDCFQRLQDRIKKRIDGENVDFFDAGLNLHFTKGLRQKLAQAWTSPYSGYPSCAFFTLESPVNDVDMPEASPAPANCEELPKKEETIRKKRPRKTEKDTSPAPKKRSKQANSQGKSATSEPPAASKERRCTRSQLRREEPEEVEEEQKPVRRVEKQDNTEESEGKEDCAEDSNNSDVPGKTKEGSGKGLYTIPKRNKC